VGYGIALRHNQNRPTVLPANNHRCQLIFASLDPGLAPKLIQRASGLDEERIKVERPYVLALDKPGVAERIPFLGYGTDIAALADLTARYRGTATAHSAPPEDILLFVISNPQRQTAANLALEDRALLLAATRAHFIFDLARAE